MARNHDRSSSAQPLVAVPSPPEVEVSGEPDHGAVGGIGHARRLYDLTERVLELELRLRERVESERVLDSEVRSLQRDSELRLAYLGELERRHHELAERSVELERDRAQLRAELEVAQHRASAEHAQRTALESRAVVRLADALARRAHSHPGSLRLGAWLARRVARRFT